MNDKLKPCPFCGGEAELRVNVCAVYIACTECSAESVHVLTSPMYTAADKAAEAWNNRVNCPECIKED